MRTVIGALLVSLCIILPAARADQQHEKATQVTETPAGKRFVATVDVDGTQRINMTGGAYYFDPEIVVVKVNVPVELMIRKEAGVAPHNIVLKAPEAGISIDESLSSEPKVIRFTPTKPGRYPFECTKRFLFFKSHKERGMHGVLEVVE
jgi:plastocyanin domain-containing protein